jgi:Fe-S cluster assembly iron-binding protein IscA
MITVTERAATAFEALLSEQDALPGQGVKLVTDGQGSIGMVIEEPEAGDEVVRRGDEPLLIVDRSIGEMLDGAVIDCADDSANGQGPTRFKLSRPPA